MTDRLISLQATLDALDAIAAEVEDGEGFQYAKWKEHMENLPSAQPDFDITVKINKAYDDGYEAGYLQGRHDWGDLDE